MPICIAKALGLLGPIEKKHKIKVVFRTFAYGAPQNQALAADELQIASAGMDPAVIAAALVAGVLAARDDWARAQAATGAVHIGVARTPDWDRLTSAAATSCPAARW
jgi:ABC-type nitrate/sulfonate/bicarbonate transport system substrate-binding protein